MTDREINALATKYVCDEITDDELFAIINNEMTEGEQLSFIVALANMSPKYVND